MTGFREDFRGSKGVFKDFMGRTEVFQGFSGVSGGFSRDFRNVSEGLSGFHWVFRGVVIAKKSRVF